MDRFNVTNGFNNKTFYCDAIIKFLEHVTDTLLLGGYPKDQLDEAIRKSILSLPKLTEAVAIESGN